MIGLSIILYIRTLLLEESFGLHPNKRYTLVRAISSYFRFAKMCLCQLRVLARCSPKYLTSSFWGSCTLFVSEDFQ
jgi:hypothetical protein